MIHPDEAYALHKSYHYPPRRYCYDEYQHLHYAFHHKRWSPQLAQKQLISSVHCFRHWLGGRLVASGYWLRREQIVQTTPS